MSFKNLENCNVTLKSLFKSLLLIRREASKQHSQHYHNSYLSKKQLQEMKQTEQGCKNDISLKRSLVPCNNECMSNGRVTPISNKTYPNLTDLLFRIRSKFNGFSQFQPPIKQSTYT